MLSLRWRDLYATPTNITNELESIVAQFKALWLTEHNEDGTHRAETRELALTPVGFIGDWPTDTPPQGWLICNGQQVNRLTYQALFNVIGTTFGAGDGSTTFNLPDARGKFALAKAAAGTGSSIGATGGSLDHTHTGPSHTHTISASGTHTHAAGTIAVDSHTHAAGTLAGPAHTHTYSAASWDTDVPSVTIQVDRNLDGVNVPVAHSGHIHTAPTGTETSSSSGTGSVTGSTAAATPGTNGSTAAGGDHDHGGATGSGGTGNTGSANPAFIVLGNSIIYSGVAA